MATFNDMQSAMEFLKHGTKTAEVSEGKVTTKAAPTDDRTAMISGIRDKILFHAIKQTISQEAIEKYGAEAINRRYLTPLCIMDVAYTIWQDKLDEVEFKHENKALQKRISKLFHEGIFAREGYLYKALTDDEVLFLCNHSEKLLEEAKTDLMKLYYTLQRECMDMKLEQRDILCRILVMETVLVITHRALFTDWESRYFTLDKAISSCGTLAKNYRQQCLGNKNVLMKFESKDLENAISIIHKRFYSVPL